MSIRSGRLLVLLIGVLWLFQGAVGQELRVALRQIPSVLDPVQSNSNTRASLNYTPFNALVEIDYNNNSDYIPGIATDWRQVDDLTWEFDIRSGVRFHDGSLLTVDDVVFTFERFLVEDGNPWYQFGGGARNRIAGVEAVGADRVRIHLTDPDRFFINRIAANRFYSVIPRHAQDMPYEQFIRTPIGTGPYRVVDVVADDFVRFEAHPDYWEGAPAAEVVMVRAVPELSTRLAGLASGEFHIIDYVSPDAMPTVASFGNASVAVAPQENIRMLVFQLDHPVVSDARIRRAMGLAIDRQLILEALWGGHNEIGQGHQLPYFGDLFLEDWPSPAYDPEEARRLVAASGYAGEELLFPVGNDVYINEVATSELLLEMWRDVGLNVRMEIKESFALVVETEGKAVHHISNGIGGPDPVFGLWSAWRWDGGSMASWVIPFWENDEFNEFGVILEASTDLEERRAAFRRMMEIWEYEDPPAAILHANALIFGVSDSVVWTPNSTPRLDFGPRTLSLR